MIGEHTQRVDEYTKDEWFSVVRQLKPGLTRDEYEVMWADFQRAKAEHYRQKQN